MKLIQLDTPRMALGAAEFVRARSAEIKILQKGKKLIASVVTSLRHKTHTFTKTPIKGLAASA
tara:strand:- start:301 stop:489 length:189 start_codon:yes stop_codon:yes gene_type:complete